MRVQLIRNIGAIEDNKPVSVNDWEQVKMNGVASIEKWINDNMNYRSCVVVLIGEETASRKWVKHEIKKAWKEKKGLVGIHIHNLKDPQTGKCKKGANPFDQFTFKDGSRLSSRVKCYDPDPNNAYKCITDNIESWIEEAIKGRQ